MDTIVKLNMRKRKILLTSFLSMALVFFTVSCSSSSDNNEDNPGTGGGSETKELTAAEVKQSLESTAQELLGKINASDFNEFSSMLNGIKYAKSDAVSEWFEACGKACEVSTSDTEYKYLIKAANFVGEFELQNGVWKQTKKGGDHLSFSFADKDNNKCLLTLKASADGTEIHHDVFDNEYWRYDYNSGTSVKYRYEYRFMLPKQIDATLTRNGEVRSSVSITSNVKTGKEVDLTKDEVEITSNAQIGAYKVVVSKVAFNAGKSAEANATISKNDETLISVSANATGNIDNELKGSYGNANVTVDILGKAKVVATVSDVSMLIENVKKAMDNDKNETQFKQCLDNANKLIDAKLYVNNSAQANAKVYLAAVGSGSGNYKYWSPELWLEFTDESKYSYSDYFNENSFKGVVDKVQSIVDDFVKMFE